MGGLKKKVKPEDLDRRLSELEELAVKNIANIEQILNSKYIEVSEKMFKTYVDFAGAFDKKHEEESAKLENTLNEWITQEGQKADAHRAKHDAMTEHHSKHMKIVEQYVQVQNEILKANTQILCDIRDCLKTLSLSKMKTGKTYGTDN